MSQRIRQFNKEMDAILHGEIQRESIYQLKITIRGCSPPIWRRVQVPGYATLSQLHRIIQKVFYWSDTHLHGFRIRNMAYGVPSAEDVWPVINEKRAVLAEVIRQEKKRFLYMYDFGDNWEHDILVEKILPLEPGMKYPQCVAGKRERPPEDCGGPWGYNELITILTDPKHPDHDEKKEWVGPYFDPEECDLTFINEQLAKMKFTPPQAKVELSGEVAKDPVARALAKVAKEKRKLGADLFESGKGAFWLIEETRSFMRVKMRFAELLVKAGRNTEAMKEYEEMLTLNDSDNLGVRYFLLGLYLAVGNLDGARRLLKQFEQDAGASFAWGGVLERLLSGDEAGAETLLARAREANQFVPPFLTGARRVPKKRPARYGFGDLSEAIVTMHEIGAAWRQHPQAMEWLKERAGTTGSLGLFEMPRNTRVSPGHDNESTAGLQSPIRNPKPR